MAPPDAPATSGEAVLSSRHEVRVIDGRFCHALLYAGTEADTEATVDVRADTDQPQRTPAP